MHKSLEGWKGQASMREGDDSISNPSPHRYAIEQSQTSTTETKFEETHYSN